MWIISHVPFVRKFQLYDIRIEYMSNKLLVGLFSVVILCFDSFFVVKQGSQIIITELGKLRVVYKDPGLYMKIPFYQTKTEYDKRMLDFEVPATELTLADQKRLVVDVFMRYKINDAAKFYRTVRTEENAKNRLSPLITGAMRNVLGTYGLPDILGNKRLAIMNDIRTMAQQITVSLGIEVVEVRISKTDFPAENSNAIYRRMISSLKKEAQKWRGKGKEEYLKRVAKADRESQEIIAIANKESREIMGQADQERLYIYNNAYSLNDAFAKWFLDLDAWKTGLSEKQSVLLIKEKYAMRE